MTITPANLCFSTLFVMAAFGAGCGSEQTTQPPPHGKDSDLTPSLEFPDRAVPRSATANKEQDHPVDVLFVEYVPTPQDVVAAMLETAGVTEDDVVYDLGCGDGRIVVTAAKQYGCRAYGCDLDHLRVKEAQENARKNRVGHLVTIERRDVLDVDLAGASVVALYLSPELIARLIPQLKRLRPGSRIVSHDFPIPGVPPNKERMMTSREDKRQHMIYLWTCPLETRP